MAIFIFITESVLGFETELNGGIVGDHKIQNLISHSDAAVVSYRRPLPFGAVSG